MSLAARALWIIERHLSEPATLADIAGACGVSRFHLAHAFGRATGQSVQAYLRGRRLTEAARKLAAGAPDILDLALGAGYGSHEAFTRAFRAQFGTTPEAVRRGASLDGLVLVDPHGPSDRTPLPIPNPRFETGSEMHFIGLRRRQRISHSRAIPMQWQDFLPEHPDIGPKAGPAPVGIVGDLDEDGGFDYTCATEVIASAEVPPGMTRRRLPPQLYAVFSHLGHASTIDGTYGAVWDVWMPNAADYTPVYAPTLERHRPAFDPRTGEGGIDLWVPVTKK